MCCFSREVERVSATRIFARPLEGVRQLLVYGMTLEVSEDVAMILPIPVPPGSQEDAVRFVDLSACPMFFDDVATLFPVIVPHDPARSGGLFAPQSAMLAVHDVGDFEASFVPSPRDFDRLDPRFRLSGEVWDALPEYADWGFCVFKLKKTTAPGGGLFGLFKKTVARKVHPMAFDFPRRDASTLFFPTVHVHDGRVHPTATFDHELYCQTDASWAPLMDWERSAKKSDALPERARPWLEAGAWLYKRALLGELPNRDTSLAESRLRARTTVADSFRLRMRAAWEHVIDDGKTVLDARTKKWMRVSEAERVRVRDAVSAQLAVVFAEKGRAWEVIPFTFDAWWQPFFASNDRIEPQELNVVFGAFPSAAVKAEIEAAFQAAIDRATAEPR